MKKMFLSIVLIASTTMNAQQKSFINNVSIETAYGYNIVMSPEVGAVKASDFSSFGTFQLGGHYQIDKQWGVRAYFASTSVKHNKFSDVDSKVHKLVAEATYKILKNNNPFQLTARAGLGVGVLPNTKNKFSDRVGIVTLGITPSYKIDKQFSVFMDLTQVIQVSQHNAYDRVPLGQTETGMMFIPSIGVSYKLK